jgi:1,4-dihydroxy-2-naphthoate octaprenyltransferase
MVANTANPPLAGEPTPSTVKGAARYVAATRPPFLIASVLPVLIGLATIEYSQIPINPLTAFLTLIGAILAHAGINVLNDYYDHLNGTDAANTERLFPFTGGSRFIQNAVLTPKQTLRYGLALFAGTIVIGLVLAYLSGLELIFIGLVGLLIGWAYSAPPLMLNSRGLGELSVALGFGILIPLGADFVQRGELSLLPLYAGFPYALLVTNLLYINQFPDLKADTLAGKHHWVVRLGTNRARWVYLIIALLAYGFLLAFTLKGRLPETALLGLIAAPISFAAGMLLVWNADKPQRLKTAIKLTILSIVVEGLTISAALLLA